MISELGKIFTYRNTDKHTYPQFWNGSTEHQHFYPTQNTGASNRWLLTVFCRDVLLVQLTMVKRTVHGSGSHHTHTHFVIHQNVISQVCPTERCVLNYGTLCNEKTITRQHRRHTVQRYGISSASQARCSTNNSTALCQTISNNLCTD